MSPSGAPYNLSFHDIDSTTSNMMSLVATVAANRVDEVAHIQRGLTAADMVLPTYRRYGNTNTAAFGQNLPPELQVFQLIIPTINLAREHLFTTKANTRANPMALELVTLQGGARTLDELLAMYAAKLSEDVGIRSVRSGESIVLQDHMHDIAVRQAAEQAAKKAKDIEARFDTLVLETMRGLSSHRSGWLGRNKKIKYRELVERSKLILGEAIELRRGLERSMADAVMREREQLPRYEA